MLLQSEIMFCELDTVHKDMKWQWNFNCDNVSVCCFSPMSGRRIDLKRLFSRYKIETNGNVKMSTVLRIDFKIRSHGIFDKTKGQLVNR